MKPTLKWSSFWILHNIHGYIERYDLRGQRLDDAGPDVCDGSYDRKELDDLIKRRLMKLIRYSKDEQGDYEPCDVCDVCGDSWTVVLTDRAIKIFWAEREHERPSPPNKRSVPRNRVRSRRKPVRNLQPTRSRRASHNGKKTVSR